MLSRLRRAEDAAEDAVEDARTWLLVAGSLVGLVYGIAIRLISGPGVMTLGFILAMPFALGFLAVFVVEREQAQKLGMWLRLPWVPLAAALVGMWLALIEGLICIAMFAPIALILASVGGVAGGLCARALRTRRSQGITLTCVAVVPFCIMPWEGPVFHRTVIREVENVIDIHAPPTVVWRNIERVPPIRTDELPVSWTRGVGFPDPVEATLSEEGVGGVRQASFKGGLLFVETVDAWQPQRRLAFTIRADRVPRATLDEHVTVGGAYFDVLRGEYRLETLANGVTRVHLSSQHRLSTDFNWYAQLWTDAVMADLQRNILSVIRQRCEKAGNS